MATLTARGVPCVYVQCVELKWLEETPPEKIGSAWTGHVFIQAEVDARTFIFDSSEIHEVETRHTRRGFEIYDNRYVVLFKGSGPREFNATTQAGIRSLLVTLSTRWHQRD